MVITSINTLKQWFQTAMKPTQEQFWAIFDSFRHKSDKVPASDIEGMDDLLLSKADKEAFTVHLADEAAHATLFGTKVDKETGKALSDQNFTVEEKNKLAGIYQWIAANVQGAPNLGALNPSMVPAGTGAAYWFSMVAGSYPNAGGVVVQANNLAVIIRDNLGSFTISQMALSVDLSTYATKTYVDTNAGKTKPFINQAYTTVDTQVSHLGKFWYNSAATAVGDIPGTSSKWVELLTGYNIPTTLIPAVKNVNLVTGNIRANQGIIFNTNGTYAVSNDYDALVLPIDANTIYKIGGLVKNGASSAGLFREDSVGSGTFTKVPDSENYLFNWFGKNSFLLLPVAFATGTNAFEFKTPSMTGLFLIVNTRYTTANTATTLVLNKAPFLLSENIEQVIPISINSKPIEDASLYFERNKVAFDNSVVKSVVAKSSIQNNTKNLFNPDNQFIGWGNVYNFYNGIVGEPNYNSVAILVDANSFCTISGDTVALNAVAGAQNYSFCRLEGGIYAPIPDADLTTFYPINGVTTAKAWVKSVRTLKLTLQVPNVTGSIYLVLNTKFQTYNNIETLQVELGTTETFYVNAKKGNIKDLLGYKITPNAIPEIPSKYENKNVFFAGDSVTEGGFPAFVATKLKCVAFNKGSSGSDTARMYNIISGTGYPVINYNLFHAVVLMIGHNVDSAGFGTVADVATAPYPATYWGNVGKSIEYLQNANPNMRIYISTLHLTDRNTYLRSKQVSDVVYAIAEYYSIPVIDAYTTCGINKKNISTYSADLTHPNAAGNVLLANAVAIGLASK